MGLRSRFFVLLAFLTACGAGSGERPVGFINHTAHSDAELWMVWHSAQQDLAKQIDLNPLQQNLDGAPTQMLPGNALALQVEPHQIEVGPESDVASAALFAATGLQRPDPTGLIACPRPCNVRYAPAYSMFETPATKYAASWESQESNFNYILQYEFENHILKELGYDLQWR